MELSQTAGQSQGAASDSLTVVAGANTANPGQLGSGQVASKSDSPSTTKTAPGPESFGQYEQYKDNQGALTGDMVIGSGDELKAGYQAAVYYKGWLTNGQLFDQSKPGSDGKLQPFILTLGAHQVIAGWEQGLLGMKVGGTRRIIIPPAYGYGATAQNGIPANSVLVFDVQLLEIKAP
jgi:FKBP-type peptidyl-prolyl cis-trans isomerase FkpA